MRKFATFAALGVMALGAITVAPTEAEARGRHGAAVAAGTVGLAAGAIIAGSAANAYGYPAYGSGYPATYGYGYAEPVHYYKPRRAVRVIVERPYYYYGPAYHYGWERPVYPHWRKKAKWRHGHWRHRHGDRYWDRPRCWLPERHLCY